MKTNAQDFKWKWTAYLLLLCSACASPENYELSYSWSPVEIGPDIEDSYQIEEIIAPYRVRLDSIMNEVIGYAAHDLTSWGGYESNLGTFVTQLLLTQSISTFDQQVDVAVMNHRGGLRAPLNEGPITTGEVFEVMPFENEMRLLEMKGSELLEVIEYISKSGRSMIWPVSYRVTKTGVENVNIKGQAIDPDRTYVMAISDYLSNGGGGFKMLIPMKRIEVKTVLQRDMIIAEIRQRTAQGDSIDTQVANLVTVSEQ